MNKPFAILLALLLASPLVVLGLAVMGLTGDFSENVPVWQAGDTWEYDDKVTMRASGSVFGLGSADAGAIVLETTSAREVMNTTHAIDDIPVYAVAHTGAFKRLSFGGNSFGVEGECNRTADGITCDGDVPREIVDEFDMGPCLTGCGVGFLGYYTKEDIALLVPGDPPIAVKNLDFPLTKGKEWTIIGAPVPMDDMDAPFALVAEAVEEEYIKLPDLGAVRTIRVDFRLSEATEAAMEQAFVDAAHSAEASGVDFDFSFSGSAWYSPSHRNIAKTVTDTLMSTRMNAQGFTGTAKFSISLEQVLTGHESTPKPERPIREAERIAELPLSTDTQKPTRIADDPWFFTVAASAISLDASRGEEVTLGLLDGWQHSDEPTDAFTTPPGTVTWTHRFVEDGKPRIERGEGPTITTAIEEPGLHVFTARVYDGDGRLLGADDLVLEGYTRTTIETPGIGGAGMMLTTPVPVAQGALWAALADETDGPFLGRLFLQDTADTVVAEKENGFAGTDHLDDLTSFMEGEWTFGYDIEAFAGHAEATLEIHYLEADGRGGWNMDDNLLPCFDPLCDLDDEHAAAVPPMTGVQGLPDLALLETLFARLL